MTRVAATCNVARDADQACRRQQWLFRALPQLWNPASILMGTASGRVEDRSKLSFDCGGLRSDDNH